jgi:truncated hemoglobin YjbI
MKTLYEHIGADFITNAITEFYLRAFNDPIIGHFFFNKNRADITAKQIDFATNLLGGPKLYKGMPLEKAHVLLNIRKPHFGRRQVLMGEVLTEMGLDERLKTSWLELEEKLRGLIVNNPRC